MKNILVTLLLFSSLLLEAKATYYPSQHKQIEPKRFLQPYQAHNKAKYLYHQATIHRNSGNYKKAFQLYHLSAMKNYAPAQYQLGMMFRHGFGVAKNRDYAKFWIKKATHNRYAMAIDIYNTFYSKKPIAQPKRYARY